MNISSWASLFGTYVDLIVRFLKLEVLSGTGITFFDVLVFICIGSVVVGALFSLSD